MCPSGSGEQQGATIFLPLAARWADQWVFQRSTSPTVVFRVDGNAKEDFATEEGSVQFTRK